jgi:hypothetical protein
MPWLLRCGLKIEMNKLIAQAQINHADFYYFWNHVEGTPRAF